VKWPSRWYLRRLRAVGVMEAVGEEDRESGEEAALIAIREVEEESGADMSLFISSLLRRDTAQEGGHNIRRLS